MKNVTYITPTVKKTITAHRITKSLMPEAVKDRLIDAAIVLAIEMENQGFELLSGNNSDLTEAFNCLVSAANEASKYTAPVEIEIDEPVRQ